MRNQRSGQQQIARRRNEVAGFIPEVGQPQQRSMGDEEKGEDESVGEQVFARRGQKTGLPWSSAYEGVITHSAMFVAGK